MITDEERQNRFDRICKLLAKIAIRIAAEEAMERKEKDNRCEVHDAFEKMSVKEVS